MWWTTHLCHRCSSTMPVTFCLLFCRACVGVLSLLMMTLLCKVSCRSFSFIITSFLFLPFFFSSSPPLPLFLLLSFSFSPFFFLFLSFSFSIWFFFSCAFDTRTFHHPGDILEMHNTPMNPGQLIAASSDCNPIFLRYGLRQVRPEENGVKRKEGRIEKYEEH